MYADAKLFVLGFPDFSLTEWFQERGRVIGDEFGKSGKDFLLETFNLKQLLLPNTCDGKRHPYSPTVNRWNIGIIT